MDWSILSPLLVRSSSQRCPKLHLFTVLTVIWSKRYYFTVWVHLNLLPKLVSVTPTFWTGDLGLTDPTLGWYVRWTRYDLFVSDRSSGHFTLVFFNGWNIVELHLIYSVYTSTEFSFGVFSSLTTNLYSTMSTWYQSRNWTCFRNLWRLNTNRTTESIHYDLSTWRVLNTGKYLYCII